MELKDTDDKPNGIVISHWHGILILRLAEILSLEKNSPSQNPNIPDAVRK